jgi:hypothetical protein
MATSNPQTPFNNLVAMTEAPTPSASGTSALRWRKEILLAIGCLGSTLLVLPALIYAVGVPLLGAYGGGEHVGSFYGDVFRNLIGLVGRTWFIVLAPYLLLCVLRLIFWPWGRKLPVNQPGPSSENGGNLAQSVASPATAKQRREPFIAP